jgi:CHAD domain-containing protein
MAEGSRRMEAALREQQRLVLATAGELGHASTTDVHQGRVAARRLRSLLKTFRPMLERRRTRLMRTDLRSFARSLALVREADVRRDLLVRLTSRDPVEEPGDIQRLQGLLDDLCLEARNSLLRHRAEPGWAALLAAIGGKGAMDELKARPDVTLAALLRLVDDAWRPAVRLLRREPSDTAELHALRLALKHCRYALESVSDLQAAEARELLKRLRNAQDRIGEHRDTLQAEHWVRSNGRSLGGPLSRFLLQLLERHEKRTRRQAAARARKVMPAYQAWRKATRRLRKGTQPGPRSR